MRCWYIDAYDQGLTSWFSDVVEQNATLTPTHRPTTPPKQDTTVSNTRQLSSLKLASRSSHLYQNVKPNSSPLELLLPLSTSLTHKTQLKETMCRQTPTNATLTSRPSRLLLTHESFVFDDIPEKDDDNKRSAGNPYIIGLGGPSLTSTLMTVSFYVGLLFAWEHVARMIIEQFQHIDPILANETNRHIIARHIAVDFTSLVYCAYLALSYRHICADMIRHGVSYGKTDSMKEDDFENRVFRYHPGSQRLLVMFFVYQVKNMYDTIKWGDGPEFVVHHILAGLAAWGGMFPGCCHFYALFFFGFSEISTAILCLLSNFDPKYGVPGLEDVFPITKMVLGGLFVVSFIICRILMWPYVSYHFGKDTLKAIRSKAKRAEGRRGYLWAIFYCCVGLSLIQLLFLWMIIDIGREEVPKFLAALQK